MMESNTNQISEGATKYSKLNYYAALIIGILSLALGLITLAAMFWIANIQSSQSAILNSQSEILNTVKKQTTVQVPIVDNQGLRNALSKPLEGTWEFVTIFTKFHGKGQEEEPQDKRWESIGKAVFIWRPNDRRYEVFFAASITESGKMGRNLVTYYANAVLPADSSGIVQEPFDLEVEYRGRTGLEGYSDPSYVKFKYNNCTFVRDENGQINKILTKFKSSKSEGEVEFTLLKK